jgi:competence protein ComGC
MQKPTAFGKMAGFIGVLMMVLVTAFGSHAKNLTSSDADAFQTVISAQLTAFKNDQWDKAFSLAAPKIQAMFGNVQRFQQMVLNGYEAVARPKIFEFGETTTVSGRPAQMVYVVGPDDLARKAIYFMEQQSDGSWRISGVVLKRIADLSS